MKKTLDQEIRELELSMVKTIKEKYPFFSEEGKKVARDIVKILA